MLILYFSEYFFDDIFECDDATGASKFIHHDAKALLLLQESVHQFLGSHRFRNERQRPDVLLPVVSIVEELGRVDVTYDIVNIFLIYNNFGVSALYEHLAQISECTVGRHRLNLCTWNHAVAHFSVRKVESILENLHFLVDFFIIFRLVDALLNEVIEVHLGEFLIVFLLFQVDTEDK